MTIDEGLNNNLTPTPKVESKARTMDFLDAMREVLKGKKVARVAWGNKDYGLLKEGWLMLYTKDAFFVWKVNDGDMEGQDWTIVI